MMTLILRLLDVRPAEARRVGAAFGSLLFIVIAHTMLETVRDAAFLAHVGAVGLGYMYIVTAALTLAVGAVSSTVVARFGVHRALIVTALCSAAGASSFCFLPPTKIVLTCLYAFSAVTGALLVPQLWAMVSAVFHAGQGRRLFGTIAIAGLLGAVLGTIATAAALLALDLRWLFLLSGAAFAIATGIICALPVLGVRQSVEREVDSVAWWGAFKEEPFLPRVALVVALGAMTTLFADYLFKAVAAARLPPGDLGSFFARYYAAMNVVALLVQVVLAPRILARAGVVGTASVMPALMLWGSVAGFVSGGAMFAVLGTRAVDGAFRHSVQRTGIELLYLAVPARPRARAKPIIDGAVTRLSQAAAAALILLLAHVGRASVRSLAFVAVCSAAGWLMATVSLHVPYVALFRRALLGTDHDEPRSPEELDLASVELLVEALSSPRAREAIAAMDALARRGRAGLVPALMLLRDEEEVLERALQLFASSPRTDWIRLCDRLLADRRDGVRRAAMRSLARARHASGTDDPRNHSALERPWIRGYLAIDALARHSAPETEALALLTADADGREARLGMLTALGDAEAQPRLAAVLSQIVDRSDGARDRETVELVARAAAAVGATGLVPWLMGMLTLRDETAAESPHTIWRGPAEGRATVRAALAALGQPAFERLERALRDPATPVHLRMHLPLSIATFKSREAADVLWRFLQGGDDGLVRYRCLRGLERLATEDGIRVPPAEARRLVRRELTEYFRMLAVRCGLEPAREPAPKVPEDTRTVVLCLIDDKCRQALARAFRLLKLCFPSEDLYQVHAAVTASDPSTRANAIEFLDALLAPRRRADHDGVRGLLRLVAEDLPDAERVTRAEGLAPQSVPHGRQEAIARLVADRDPLLAELAVSLSKELGGDAGRARAVSLEVGEEDASIAATLRPLGAHGR